MDKILAQLKAIVAAILAWPVIAPLVNLLHRRRIIVPAICAFVYLVEAQLTFLPPDKLSNLMNGTLLFAAFMAANFAIEGTLTAFKGLPKNAMEAFLAIVGEITNPSPDTLAKWNGASQTAAAVIPGTPDSTA